MMDSSNGNSVGYKPKPKCDITNNYIAIDGNGKPPSRKDGVR